MEKTTTYFYKRSDSIDGFRNTCKDCAEQNRNYKRLLYRDKINSTTRKWNSKNKEKIKDYHFRSKYNISLEDRNTMIRQQNGKCAICRKKKRLCVDHNKTTGAVRKMLCDNCNMGIGLFHENTQFLLSACEYLNMCL